MCLHKIKLLCWDPASGGLPVFTLIGYITQEELLLVGTMALAIVNLLVTLSRDTAQDYVYAAFFLICTTFFLKVLSSRPSLSPAMPGSSSHVVFSSRPELLCKFTILLFLWSMCLQGHIVVRLVGHHCSVPGSHDTAVCQWPCNYACCGLHASDCNSAA